MKAALTPLRFEHLGRRYIWGGRRLATELGKPIGTGDDHAESWELVDHGADQSIVSAGPCAGMSLGQLVRDRGPELLGKHYPLAAFPLLVKFLDATKVLSVQVHPNDAQASLQTPPDLGKTEAWVILAAEPGSVMFAGLKPGVDRSQLEAAVRNGDCESVLHRVHPKPGDCIFIPAGTVHALGQGLLVAEIQQSSDTTFRLFDWNRVGPDGKSRALHINESLEVVDFERGPVEPQKPQPTGRPCVERLVACDKFVIDRCDITGPQTIGGDERFHIVCVLEGSASMADDPVDKPLVRGCTALLPASLGPVTITPHGKAVLLDAYLP